MMAKNGLQPQVFTDQPGLQLYTGEFIIAIGHNGVSYGLYFFVFEPQSYSSSLTVSFFPA